MSAPRVATALLVALVAWAAALPVFAAEQALRLEIGISTLYDDNILDFSPDQLREFDPVGQPRRFATETTDDILLVPSLALGWELDEGGGRRHALRVRGEADSHVRNGTADDRTWSGRWRESFAGGRRLTLGYSVLPRYYLRQLLDEDAPAGPGDARYRRAEFALHIASASWTQRAGGPRRLSLGYQFERRRYNADFRERDSDAHQGVVGFGWRGLPGRGAIDLRGGYRTSHARGEDGDDAPGTVPDDADLSYHGALAGVAGRVDFAQARAVRLGGDLAYELETRTFISDRPLDRYHFGRSDVLQAVELGLRAALPPHWSLRVFYRLEDNTARLGAGAPASSEVGSYRDNQVGLTLAWSGDIWRRGGDTGEDDAEP